MPHSIHFLNLLHRAGELRANMLPQKFDPTALLARRQYDRIAGYRLLIHAEMEYCMERIVLDALARCLAAGTHGYASPASAAFVACAAVNFKEDKTKALSIPRTSSLKKRDLSQLAAGQSKFTAVIDRNHGIRTWNVYRILLPVGVRKRTIDSLLGGAWLQKIDEFGQQRGNIAHQSGRIYQPPDPQDAYDAVKLIVRGIRLLDSQLLSTRYRLLPR